VSVFLDMMVLLVKMVSFLFLFSFPFLRREEEIEKKIVQMIKNLILDVNECLTNNGGCHAQAICTNTPGSFTCACKDGYSGNGFDCEGTINLIFDINSHSFNYSIILSFHNLQKKKKILMNAYPMYVMSSLVA